MNKLRFFSVLITLTTLFYSCSDTVTYTEQKDREREAINKYIIESGIKVISETEFKANDSTTNVEKNEYVLFNSSGIYMQIVRKGVGDKLKNGQTEDILCRFTEINLLTKSLLLSNNAQLYTTQVDKMTVTNSRGTFTGSFVSGLMKNTYGSAVPSGWLYPLNYINLGRQDSENAEIAKVKLIVPHSQGQAVATQGVYPCFYEITYQKGI